MQGRRVSDRVHGELQLPALAAELTATVEFARLRRILQLGACHMVFPAASHTRFEHSLGVCHLGGVIARHLQRSLDVQDDDVLCVQLAGLLHDLGHGPLSHLFEAFVPGFRHEEMSVTLFRLLLQRHPEIRPETHFAGDVQRNLAFVELLIRGHDPSQPWPEAEVGRPHAKRYLADIIHAHTTGIDADRLDYLLRDTLAVFGSTNMFCVSRLIAAMRIHEDTICFDESVAQEVADVYRLRARLHRQLYQHRAVLVAERLHRELMHSIDLHSDTKLAELAADPVRFVELDDSTVLRPRDMTDPLYSTPCRAAFLRLFRRPWVQRVPLTVSLPTKPYCCSCRHETEIADIFCALCGTLTAARPCIRDGRGWCEPPECALSATDIEAALRKVHACEDVWVTVADVSCGASRGVRDRHGATWMDHDALASVTFLDHAGAPLVKVASELFLAPQRGRMRLVYCYLPVEADDTSVRVVSSVFREWGERSGTVSQLSACDIVP